MYEAQTYESILARMLQKALSINSNLDTREGSLVWYGDAPAAVELQNLYIALDTVLNETFADTATRPYLILRAAERGLSPQPASPAILQMAITPTTLFLPLNTRFSIGELNYYVSADRGSGNYELTCETAGESGNNYTGTVIPIEYVDGLETCKITSVLVPGEDEEDTELFRQRYLNSLNAQAFGGNQIDYIEKVNAIPGVGGVKVYRAWNGDLKPANMIPPKEAEAWIEGLSGVPEPVKLWLDTVYAAAKNNMFTVGGTVKLVVINSTFTVPSPTLVEQVQTAVDPLQNAGEGVGLAPIAMWSGWKVFRKKPLIWALPCIINGGGLGKMFPGMSRKQLTGTSWNWPKVGRIRMKPLWFVSAKLKAACWVSPVFWILPTPRSMKKPPIIHWPLTISRCWVPLHQPLLKLRHKGW